MPARSGREGAPRYALCCLLSSLTPSLLSLLSHPPSRSSPSTRSATMALLAANFSELLGYTSIACWLGAQFP